MQNKRLVLNTVKSCLDRISAVNEKLNAIIHIDTEKVRKVAAEKPSATPIAIKDNICVKDEPTTCASKILRGFRPPYDATVIRKLKEANFVLMGKANMDEFAFGSSCETSCYGPTKNPWDPKRIPGG